MEVEFETFKSHFSRWAADQLEYWAREFNVAKLPFVIVSEEQLDPWEAGPVYVIPGFRHSGINGPVIIIPERYLAHVYFAASKKNRMAELWNLLYWTLAHEFGHYLKFLNPQLRIAFLERISPPKCPFGLLREGIRRAEIGASVRALGMTSKTRSKHVLDFVEVMGMTPARYVAETTRRKREWKP